MTLESARRLAETLYGPFIKAGLIDEKSIQAAVTLIQSHVELDEQLAEYEVLKKRAETRAVGVRHVRETLCWKCDNSYLIHHLSCPHCDAANANISPELAEQQRRDFFNQPPKYDGRNA